MYIDIHTHLTHDKFAHDQAEVIARANTAGFKAVVVNGLEPNSNRQILELAKKHSIIKPALGIYPLEAVNHLNPDLPFSLSQFNVNEEIEFIRSQAEQGNLAAIGECGLDGYWVGKETFAEQERVFRELITIALNHDLPLIIHTRKLEIRSMEILKEMGVKKVNFHCYGSKVKQALRWAQEYGWYFSIPTNVNKDEAFQKLAKELPEQQILTETDAPYLSANKGQRNEPVYITESLAQIAKIRQKSISDLKEIIYKNYCRLIGNKKFY